MKMIDEVAMKTMKKMKAAMKSAKSISKGAITDVLVAKNGLKKAEAMKMIDDLVALATVEVKKSGKFTLPGLVMIKTRIKPARKAGKRMAFGKEIKVKAAPAKKVVKAFCVSALKKSI